MPIALSPRRVVSTATTITVNSAATALSAAIPAANTMARFDGGGLSTTAPHPFNSFPVTVLQDGLSANNKPTLGWAGKGVYDPTNKQVIFIGCGAGGSSYNSGNSYVLNLLARYSETAIPALGTTANNWDSIRGFQPANNGTNEYLVHIYDSNCIDVAGRRMFHKNGHANKWLIYNLDTGAFSSCLDGPSNHGDVFAAWWWSGAEFVPTRSALGCLWCFGWTSGGALTLWEYDFSAPGSWSTIKSWADFGSPASDGAYNSAPTISFNPRAFSGAGGCMLGYAGDTWTITTPAKPATPTLTKLTTNAPPTGTISPNYVSTNGRSYNNGFCRDPVGDGWLQFYQGNGNVYRYSTTTGQWENRGSVLPAGLLPGSTTPCNFIVVPIDAVGSTYGAVWLINDGQGLGSTYGAWLYNAR